MVVKKDLISEFQKLNTELEKHLGKLGTEFLVDNQLDFNHSDSNSQKEDLTLLSSSLLDIRMELSLIRKNFTSDLENLMLQLIKEEQNHFLNSMNSIQSNLALEMKKNFGLEIKELVSELRDIKTSLKKNSLSIEKNNNDLNEIKESQSQIKDLLENSSILQDFEYEKLLEEIKEINFSINSKNSSQNDFSQNYNLLSSNIKKIENEILGLKNVVLSNNKSLENFSSQIKHNSNLEKNLLLNNLVENDKKKEEEKQLNQILVELKHIEEKTNAQEKHVEKKIINQDSNLNNKEKFNLTSNHNNKQGKLLSIEKNLANLEKTTTQKSSNVNQKFFDIDSKLKQLNLVE